MAEDKEKMKKMRCRMERDAYSVLLSFKDGANPRSLERRMDETLGYTYHNKYHEGGVHDMEQLLNEHPKVQYIGGGAYRIIPTEEVRDLVELIRHQKDRNDERGRERRSRHGTTPRSRRLGSLGTFRSGFGGSLGFRQTKGFGGLRPITSVAKNYPDGGSSCFKPLMSISLSPSPYITTCLTTSGLPNFGQRPLTRPAVTPSSFEPTPVVEPPKPQEEPTKQASAIPTIKEFWANTEKMLRKVNHSVHLSEMIDLYAKEFGVVVDPLRLFSKSWKMLVQTTFKSWLEMDSEGLVRLRDSAVKTEARRTEVVKNVPKRSSRSASPMTADFATVQGFRYQNTPKKGVIHTVLDDFEELSITARPPLPAPQKPPGFTREPDLLMSIMRSKSACSNLGELLSESQLPGAYDKKCMMSLRKVNKSEEMEKRIAEALSEHKLKRGSPQFRPIHSRSNTNTHQLNTRSAPQPDPYASLPKFGQRIIPPRSNPDIQKFVKPMETMVKPTVEKLPEVQTVPARTTAYYPPSVNMQTRQPKLIEPTPEVREEEVYNQPSVPTRRPSKLPPMSKGKGIPSAPRPSSAASSCTRKFNEAVFSQLPYDDDFW